MRLFRLSLLRTYFSLIENKKKALRIINVGIFLSIFASTSAVITFYIEQQINETEFLLIEEQFQANDASSTIAEFESTISLFEEIRRSEFIQTENVFFLGLTTFGNRAISENDYYAPIIYTSLKDIEDIDELFELETNGMNINEYLISLIEGTWEKSEVKEAKKILDSFYINYKNVKEIDINFYKTLIFEKTPEILLDELTSQKKNSIDPYSKSKIFSHYNEVYEFNENAIIFFRLLYKVINATRAANFEKIEILNSKIIDLSNKEKKLIFLTFIFQLIAFVLIQIFEVSSMNINKKDKE
tara:strand:+ start:176 stop:1075 length:900 start_codon:yes stop_codon:yes gene_type:complete